MAGKYGVSELLKCAQIVGDVAAIVKDIAVDKSTMKALTPAWDLLGLVKSGIDLKEVSNEIGELDGEDLKAFLAGLTGALAQLQLPAIQNAVATGAVLAVKLERYAEEGIVLFGEAKQWYDATFHSAPVVHPVLGMPEGSPVEA